MTVTMLQVIFFTMLVACIGGLTHLLSKRNGSDIRVVWYFFSLTAVISFGLAQIAISIEAIKDGDFVGKYGDLFSTLISVMLDFEKDFWIVTGVAAVITIPQFTSYILSGLSGNAKSPILMHESLSFAVWGIIKSLVVCAAILISLGVMVLLGYFKGSGDLPKYLTGTGMYSLLLAYCIITLYREAEALTQWLVRHLPCLKAIHQWFTRKERISISNEVVGDIEISEMFKSLLNLITQLQRLAHKYEKWTMKSPGTASQEEKRSD